MVLQLLLHVATAEDRIVHPLLEVPPKKEKNAGGGKSYRFPFFFFTLLLL